MPSLCSAQEDQPDIAAAREKTQQCLKKTLLNQTSCGCSSRFWYLLHADEKAVYRALILKTLSKILLKTFTGIMIVLLICKKILMPFGQGKWKRCGLCDCHLGFTYRKEKNTDRIHPTSIPTACGGSSGGPGGWRKDLLQDTPLPAPLHLCCVHSQHVRTQLLRITRREGKSRRMQRYAGRSLWDKSVCPRLQRCVPFLGICPPAACNFRTGKSDDCITTSFSSEQKVHFCNV